MQCSRYTSEIRNRSGWRGVAVMMIGLVGIAGCAPRQATLRSAVSAKGVTPIQRVVVYSDLESPGVTRVASAAFEADVVRRFAACGVAAHVVTEDRMDPTPREARVEAAMHEFETGTLMVVRAAGGQIGTSRSWKNINLQLSDIENPGSTWLADASTPFSSDQVGAAADGTALSILVVTRLRDDGLLTRCKSTEAYPGCFDDLHREIASRSRDAISIEPLPKCTASGEDR